MDPYLWTWLARYGGGCLLALLWTATALREGVKRRWGSALVFGGLAAVTAAALGTHLVPLLAGGGVLVAGLLLLGVAAGVDHQRMDLREAARGQGLGTDYAVQLVSAATGGLELLGWAATTGWAVRSRREVSVPSREQEPRPARASAARARPARTPRRRSGSRSCRRPSASRASDG